jgi:predicted ATPase/DNA-binding SARP family transcriptional activator
MHLAIQLLGTPQFQLDDVPVAASRRAVVALLAYLAVTDREHPGQRSSRDALATLFWTDYDLAKGLANLRHTLWEVTKFIGEGWVTTEHETVFLNPKAELTLDAALFRSLVAQAKRESDPAGRIPLLAEAAKLYRDQFLSGFTLKEGASFNEWVLTNAESLRREFASALDMLVEDYSTVGQAQAAIPYAQRRIELNPLNEAAHQKLMWLYASTDGHTAALQQYRSLEKLLRKELNLDPQPETRELYKKIRKGEFKPVSGQSQTARLEWSKPKHNLPVQLTSFIGRERERHEIARLITHNRLVTLIGAGGIGKTRLALQTAQSLRNDYPDGVWFVPLESLADEDLVAQTVASFLNIAEASDQSLLETLGNELRDRTLLLILDNCEHVLDACARLAETLLKNCPNIKLLATSRDLLRLDGEAVYHVPPLTIPDSHPAGSVEEVANSESVQLFAQRAALVRSSFEITKTNALTLVKICNRLDGIPLAIELAAAHVNIFTLEEILNQLNHSFDLLASNARSTLPRHQTMRASIAWGWKLLTEAERIFMRRLSVFPGGWTLQAARAIGVQDSLERTSALWKKSFVVVHQQAGYETRYGFHEVVRSFAQERLVEAGEDKTIRDRHLDYYLALLRQLEPALQSVDQDTWLERLFLERDNIRAALEWAARTNVQAGLYLSNRLRTFWETYDLREEARWLLMI